MNTKPTIHVIAPFYSRLEKERWSHCAFSQITLKQIKIFGKLLGCRVLDYSNYGSESTADEHVEVLDKRLFHAQFTDDGMPGHGNKGVIGSPGWRLWNFHLTNKIKERVKAPGNHIVVHTFGDAASNLVRDLDGNVQHLESHIGYERGPFGAKRVYVSDAWRHHCWGKFGSDMAERRYSWVIHPYYEREDWPFVAADSERGLEPTVFPPYIAFMGRVVADKGIGTILAIAEARPDWQFRLAGSGDISLFKLPSNVTYLGVLPGNKRAEFLGNASVQVLPTEYVEPCAGSVIEGMLTGTPAVTSSWGGFTETVRGPGGYRASTLQEWISAIKSAQLFDRVNVRAYALQRFTLEHAAIAYGRVIEQMLSFYGRGWYEQS